MIMSFVILEITLDHYLYTRGSQMENFKDMFFLTFLAQEEQ